MLVDDGSRQVWDEMQTDALDRCAHCDQLVYSEDGRTCPACGLPLSVVSVGGVDIDTQQRVHAIDCDMDEDCTCQ